MKTLCLFVQKGKGRKGKYQAVIPLGNEEYITVRVQKSELDLVEALHTKPIGRFETLLNTVDYGHLESLHKS